jgi:arsenate reductase
MTVTIYHNPRCGKSRETLALLEKKGERPVVIEYLKTPPGKAELKRLLKLLGKTPRELLRAKEAKAVGLDKAGLGEDAILDGMVAHPIVIERPIVVKGQPRGPRPPARGGAEDSLGRHTHGRVFGERPIDPNVALC